VNRNNLRLNCSKSCEVIFSDSRRRSRSVPQPAPLPGITRSRCLKVLGVNIASDFSVSQYIQRLVTASSQTVYALRLLRSRGLCNTALQHVWSPTYRLGDRPCPPQRVLRVRPTIFWWTICDDADDELFNKAVRLSNHVLHSLLPPPSSASQRYNLRNWTHLLQLPDHTTHLSDKNFITHMLYRNAY